MEERGSGSYLHLAPHSCGNQVVKNPQVPAKDVQEDLMAASTEGLYVRTP